MAPLSVTWAEDLVYRYEGIPLFSIQIPDGWTVDLNFEQEAREAGVPEGEEPRFRVAEVSPEDGGHVWLGFWAVPMSGTIDEGQAYFESLGGDLFSDRKVSDPVDDSHNGMTTRTWKGTGKHDGEEVEFVMSIFEPRSGTIAAALYVGAKDAWQAYEDELAAMVASIQPAGD
jgi:hypothetical protein